MILYRTIWELWSGLMWILAVLASGLCVRQCIHMFLLITADTSSGGTSVFSKSSMSMFLPKLDTLGNSRPSRRGPQSESSKLRLALRYMYGVCFCLGRHPVQLHSSIGTPPPAGPCIPPRRRDSPERRGARRKSRRGRCMCRAWGPWYTRMSRVQV